jgi:hypothetical protein
VLSPPHRSLPGQHVPWKGGRRLDNSQPLAAFQSPGLQHVPSAAGTHSLEKTVLSLARYLFRLVCPLGHSNPLLSSLGFVHPRTGASACRPSAGYFRLAGANPSHPAQVCGREGKQRQMARPLDRGCQNALVPRARAGAAPGRYSPSVGYETAQPRSVFVVNGVRFASAEGAYLPDGCIPWSATPCWPWS